MEYNKKKKEIEHAAGLIGMVLSLISIFLFVNLIYILVDDNSIILAVLCLLLTIMHIVEFVLCHKIFNEPVKENGIIEDRIKLRVYVIVFSFFTMNIITLVFEVAALCMKDIQQKTIRNIYEYSIAEKEVTLDEKIEDIKSSIAKDKSNK